MYDRYGNRWQQNVTAGSGPAPQYAFNANNRITTSGFTYDAAGNINNDTVHAYTYDAENRIIKVDSGTTAVYTYDAEGRRVAKTTSAASYEYLFDLGGRDVTELLAGTATTNRTEAYGAGRHLATQNVGLGTSYFIHTDWQGTERARTNVSNAVTESCTNLPYGDDLNCTGTDVSPLHFTGKQRDSETGDDYFGARYYGSTAGRFLTPDWAARPTAVPYAVFGDPQSLNLYGYVRNDPVTRADADGHCGSNQHFNGAGECIGNPMPAAGTMMDDPEADAEAKYDQQVAEAQNTADQQQGQGATQGTSTTPAATAPTKQFISINSAGIAGEKIYNPASKSENLEFNGNIYKDSQGNCCFLQTPAKGTADSSSPPDVSTLPAGASRVATYHTHAAYDPRYDNEHFSPADKTNAGRRGVPIFVGTPGGVIRKYDPATGRITTFHSTTD